MILLMILLLQPVPDDFSPVDFLVTALQTDSMYSNPFPEDVLIILAERATTRKFDHYVVRWHIVLIF